MNEVSEMSELELRKAAKKRVGIKMGFYIHLLVFVAVNSGLYLLNNFTSGFNNGLRWHHFPLFGWGIGLAIHGLVTFLSLQGMGLRERLLEQEIESLRRRQR
ncbi:2TM domain-containing protein [Roseateles sp. GG27B]